MSRRGEGVGRGGVRKSGRQTVGREGNREWGERGSE